MKDWTGAIIATIAIIGALVVDPSTLHLNTTLTPASFALILLCMTGIAFAFAYRAPELGVTRQVTIWLAGFAVIAIAAKNIDSLTGRTMPHLVASKPEKPAAEPEKPQKHRKKKPASAGIYVPDTAKINRVEKLVTRQDLNPFADPDNQTKVENKFNKTDTRLDESWTLNEEQKEQFKKFIESQGLDYDPETAFKTPEIPQNAPEYNSPGTEIPGSGGENTNRASTGTNSSKEGS